MKKIYNIMMLLACLTFFWACETDRDNPTALTPDSFVLNTPPYVTGIYDLRNTETVLLTTSQPDYGFTAATIYRVQIATQNSFEEFVTLPSFFTSARMEVSAAEMATALVGLLGIENEEDFPTETFPVFIRLSAELTNGSRQVLSNIIELPKVRSYFALDPMVMPENMYIVGNVTDWSWDSSTSMVPVWGKPGKFWVVQYLGKVDGNNAEIKFNMVKDWNDTAFGIKAAQIDDASKTLAGISGDDNITIGNPGWYIIVVTTEISGRDYIYHVQFLKPEVYLTGDTSGGWDTFDAARLFTVPDLSLGADANFVSPAFVGNGEIRACIKLDDQDWWHTEFIVLNGKLVFRGTGDDQERALGSVGQKLHINFTKLTGKVE